MIRLKRWRNVQLISLSELGDKRRLMGNRRRDWDAVGQDQWLEHEQRVVVLAQCHNVTAFCDSKADATGELQVIKGDKDYQSRKKFS